MKKIYVLLLLAPLLMATQCDDDDCNTTIIYKEKPNLITVENLQQNYHVGDIIWLSSTLTRIQDFENPTDTADLYAVGLDFCYNVEFVKISPYNPAIYLNLPQNTLEISSGSATNNNAFVYEKDGDILKNRIGIRLLETGNFRISVYNIANFRENGLDCNDTGYSITTNFSNNSAQSVNFTVE